MRVAINQAWYDYNSDYSPQNRSWKRKLKDAFRDDVMIGPYRCFVKRFEEKPSAIELLTKIQKLQVVNMPKVYDVVTAVENGKAVDYAFFEWKNGKTLKEYILANKPFDTNKLLTAILDSLEFIHYNQYWFGDLNEENIFCTDNGEYVLIDVDSCWYADIRPCADTSKPGGMPGAAQEYADVALKFYKEIRNLPFFTYEQMEGKNLNQLQLLALIAKLEYYNAHKRENSLFNYSVKLSYRYLHYYMLGKNRLYCENVFDRALNNTLQYVITLTFGKIITGEMPTVVIKDMPVIEKFSLSDHMVFTGVDNSLIWKITGSGSVWLEGSSFSKNVSKSFSYPIKPKSAETYNLVAVNNEGIKISKTLQFKPTDILKPVIIYFKTSSDKVKKGESITLAWKVNNADKLFINGEVQELDVNTMVVAPVATNTIYTLKARNKVNAEANSQVSVKVTPKTKPGLVAAVIIAALLLAFAIWQIVENTRYNEKIDDGRKAFDNGNYSYASLCYKEARDIEEQVIIGEKQNVNLLIKRADFEYLKNYGIKLLKAGAILPPNDNPDSTSAISTFREAQLLESYDDELNAMIAFCEKVKTARDYRLKSSYSQALQWYEAALAYSHSVNLKVDQEKVLALPKSLCFAGIGDSNFTLQDYYAAKMNYDSSLAYDDDREGLVYFRRGYSRHKTSDYQGAVDDYLKCIKLKYSLAACFNNLGVAYLALGYPNLACENISRAHNLEPDNQLYTNNYNNYNCQ